MTTNKSRSSDATLARGSRAVITRTHLATGRVRRWHGVIVTPPDADSVELRSGTAEQSWFALGRHSGYSTTITAERS